MSRLVEIVAFFVGTQTDEQKSARRGQVQWIEREELFDAVHSSTCAASLGTYLVPVEEGREGGDGEIPYY